MKNKSVWILVFIFLLLLSVLNYVHSNYGDLLARRADYLFRKNKVELAQKYYEEAFELGFNKSQEREIYVNSIINSPLTLDAQDKLVKFLKNPKKDVASAKAELFLYDFKREIFRKYKYNYISNAVYNQKTSV